ncbi:hypothetical protein HRG84_11970 [Flavisolibacter sp. BT320]|nr:hypothetical protein [Flavisolibacter longurius]
MKTKLCTLLLAVFFSLTGKAQSDTLTNYMAHIKAAYEKRSAETSMGTIGYEMVYGLESFEAKSYDYASWRFEAILRMDANHSISYYLLGLCQLAMGKDAAGKASLEKAIALLPELKQRRDGDIALYSKKGTTTTVAAQVKRNETTPVKKEEKPTAESAGGPLVFGNYNCHYQQYQGAGAIVAYKSIPQGYFRLNANGTYRWLDNGETGKYKYDAKTGKITWLSGYFAKSKPVSTRYISGEKVASIKVEMRPNYTWGCGCNK